MEHLPSIADIQEDQQFLTIEVAEKLYGKSIVCYSDDQPGVRKIFAVGKLVNAFEWALTQFCSDLRYANMQVFYVANCSEDVIDNLRNKYILFSVNGEAVYTAYTGKYDVKGGGKFVAANPSFDVLFKELELYGS